jgi:hypothetical protein
LLENQAEVRSTECYVDTSRQEETYKKLKSEHHSVLLKVQLLEDQYSLSLRRIEMLTQSLENVRTSQNTKFIEQALRNVRNQQETKTVINIMHNHNHPPSQSISQLQEVYHASLETVQRQSDEILRMKQIVSQLDSKLQNVTDSESTSNQDDSAIGPVAPDDVILAETRLALISLSQSLQGQQNQPSSSNNAEPEWLSRIISSLQNPPDQMDTRDSQALEVVHDSLMSLNNEIHAVKECQEQVRRERLALISALESERGVLSAMMDLSNPENISTQGDYDFRLSIRPDDESLSEGSEIPQWKAKCRNILKCLDERDMQLLQLRRDYEDLVRSKIELIQTSSAELRRVKNQLVEWKYSESLRDQRKTYARRQLAEEAARNRYQCSIM